MNDTNRDYSEFIIINHINNVEDNETSDNRHDLQYIKVHTNSADREQLTGKQFRDFNGEQRKKLYLGINKKLGAY